MGNLAVKGKYVRIPSHPEYGVGRIVSVGAFATHAVFLSGGSRVFRLDDESRMAIASAPGDDDIATLDKKEADWARGQGDPAVGAGTPSPAEPAKKKPKKAAKKSASV